MSVYQVTVSEVGTGRLTSRYAIEANSTAIACELAIGVHSMLEKIDRDVLEVTSLLKTDIRRCIAFSPSEGQGDLLCAKT